MRESLHRHLGFACVLLLGSATFAACGSLDPRKVTRGPEFQSGGGEDNEAGSGPGPGPDSGGSSSKGGEMGNPFGGQLFTGGAPPVLDGPPEVLEVDPGDLATDVDVDTDVSLLFSEAIDPATVTDASVELLYGGSAVSGRVGLDETNGVVATIDPTRRLALAATYDVSVSTAVTDTTGTALEETFSSSFTTRDGTWDVTDSAFVADPGNNWYMYNEAFVAVDGRGNAVVAWPQPDPVSNSQSVFARWHRATTGWQDAVQLSSGVNYTGYPTVSANDDGDAVVVWSEYNSTLSAYEVLARRYVNGAWSAAPEPVHGDLAMANGVYSGPFVKMRGDRVVVWWTTPYQSGNNYYDYLYAQTATAAGAWRTSPQYVTSVGATEDIGPSALAMDSSGNGMLAFPVSTTTNVLHFAKYVTATDAWEQAAPIPSANNVLYDTPAVALDETGAAMVAWRNNVAPYDLMASRYTKARGFAMPTTLDELDSEPRLSYSNPIATDGTNFFISWVQTVGSTGNVYGAYYATADGVWTTAELLSDGDTGVDYPPSTVADPQGNAMSIWLQGSPTYDGMNYDYSAVEWKYSRFLASDAAWHAPAVLAGGQAYDRYHGHRSATAANGITAVLTYFEGYYDSATQMYTPAEPWLNVFR